MTGLHPAALAVLVIISVFLLVGLSSATVHVDVEAPWSLDERDAFVAEARFDLLPLALVAQTHSYPLNSICLIFLTLPFECYF